MRKVKSLHCHTGYAVDSCPSTIQNIFCGGHRENTCNDNGKPQEIEYE